MRQKGNVQLLVILTVVAIVIFLLFTGLFNHSEVFASSFNAIRGQTDDYWADIIIGKPDFTEINPFTTVANKLWLPHGVIVDRNNTSDNKIYIDDAGNNRILGFDLNKCLASQTNPLGCTADVVLGQPNMSTSACNGDSGFQNYPNRAIPNASSLCGLDEAQLSVGEGGSGASMAVDSSGALYVFDAFNNRVLKYNSPFNTDAVADDVWGQSDFSGSECNQGKSSPGATTLCYSWGDTNNWTAGVDIDSSGNLWVVDSGNNRVLRFPSGSKTADLVLGQSDFTHSGTGSGLNQLHDPSVVRVNSQGWVYVADQGNNRVLVFKGTLSSGMSGAVFGSGFSSPSGIDFDPTQSGVWITDQGNKSIELWDENTETLTKQVGASNNGTLGDASGSVGVDSAGDLFIAIGLPPYDNDVLMFAPGATSSPTQHLFGTADNNIDEKGTGGIAGVAYYDNQLVVADGRLLFWNNPQSLTNGQAADGFALASNFNSTYFGCCQAMTADKAGHLYISLGIAGDFPNRIQVYPLPMTSGESATTTLLNTSLQVGPNTLPLEGGGSITMDGPYFGLAASSDGNFLWVSDQTDNRVVRIRDPLGSTPTVDVVLGQSNATGTQCNRGGLVGPTTLCDPGSLSLDRNGNLYISDESLEIRGNMRLLEFNSDLFPTDGTQVIYATTPSKIFPNVATWQPAFDSKNRMVVGYNPYWTANPKGGWFPGVYLNPLDPNSTTPDNTLNDYYSMAFAAAFDDQDNLYVGDLDRSRVLVYKQPFIASVTSPPVTLAVSSSGQSQPSCTSGALTGSPNLFQIDAAGTYANLYFTTISGASGYRISFGLNRSANQYGDDFDYSGPEWVLGRAINSLSPNTTYYFRVQAKNGCNGSAWSNVASVKTGGILSNITRFFANLASKSPVRVNASNVISIKGCSYVVQSGDSLWAIALKKWGDGTKYNQIITLNSKNALRLRAGQTLNLCSS